jgi:hypothetical protein
MSRKREVFPKEPLLVKVMAYAAIAAVLIFPALFSLLFGHRFGIVGMIAAVGVLAVSFLTAKAYMRANRRDP